MQGWFEPKRGALTWPIGKAFCNCPGYESAAGRGVSPTPETHLGTLDSLKTLEGEERADQGQGPLAVVTKACRTLTGSCGLDLRASQAQILALPALPDMSPPLKEFCPPCHRS